MQETKQAHVSETAAAYAVEPYVRNEGSVGNKRIVFIGASYKFVHKVLRDMLLVGGFDECELVVHDIDPVPMDTVARLLERIVEQTGSRIRVRRTLDRREALKGADAAVLSITTGGEESDARSWDVCHKYGIPVGIGDTLGPAAFARNLRSVPVVVDIIRDMEELCPDAVMLNFTNPLSCLTAAMARRRSIPAWGLCHSADEMYSYFATVFDCEKTEIEMDVGGVNHQSFVTRLLVNGVDRTAEIQNATEAAPQPHESVELQQELFSILGAWPSTGETHLAEFYPFYFTPERVKRFAGHMKLPAPEREAYGRRPCPPIIQRWASGPAPVEDLHLLTTEHAHELLWSAFTGAPFSRILNVLNAGYLIQGIPEDVCVEALVTVAGKKVTGQSIGLPPAVHSLVQRWTTIQDLTLTAALDCNRDAARQALFLDPHLRDPATIDPLLDDMIVALEPWLPARWHSAMA